MKKIRLLGEDAGDTVTEVAEKVVVSGGLSERQAKDLLKYAESIDWKLWEILSLLKRQAGED